MTLVVFCLIMFELVGLTSDYIEGEQSEQTSFIHLNRFDGVEYNLKDYSFQFSYFLTEEIPEHIGRFIIDRFDTQSCDEDRCLKEIEMVTCPREYIDAKKDIMKTRT